MVRHFFKRLIGFVTLYCVCATVFGAVEPDYWNQQNKDGHWRNASDRGLSGTPQVAWARILEDYPNFGEDYLLAQWAQRSNNLCIREGRIGIFIPSVDMDLAELGAFAGQNKYTYASFGVFNLRNGDKMSEILSPHAGAGGLFTQYGSASYAVMDCDQQDGLVNLYWNRDGVVFTANGSDNSGSFQFDPYSADLPFGATEVSLCGPSSNASGFFAMSDANPLIYATGGGGAHDSFAPNQKYGGLIGEGRSNIISMKMYNAHVVEDDMIYSFTLTNIINNVNKAFGVKIEARSFASDPYSSSVEWTYEDADKVFLDFGVYHGCGAPRAACLSDDGGTLYYFAVKTAGTGASQDVNMDPDNGGGFCLVGVDTSDGSEAFCSASVPNFNPDAEYAGDLENDYWKLLPQIAVKGNYVVVFQPQQAAYKTYYSSWYGHIFCFNATTGALLWRKDYADGYFNTDVICGTGSYSAAYQLEQSVQMTIAGDHAYIVEPDEIDVSGTDKLRLNVHQFPLNGRSDGGTLNPTITTLTPTDVDTTEQITVTNVINRADPSTGAYVYTDRNENVLALRDLAAVDNKLVCLLDVATHDQALVVVDGSTNPSVDYDPVAVISAPETGRPLQQVFADAPAPTNQFPSGEEIQFNSTGSFDPDGGALTYLWDFGDGTTSTAANPTHTYASIGAYDSTIDRAVSLTVTDDDGGATDFVSKTLRIRNLDNRVYTEVETCADSYVSTSASNSGTNYGSETLLSAWYDTARNNIYLKFDLAAAGIDNMARISAAKLRITMERREYYSNNLQVRGCSDDSWTEGTITGDNAPAAGAVENDIQLTSLPAFHTYIDIPVTNAVKSLGTDGVVSLVLDLEEVKFRSFKFASKENADLEAARLIMDVIDTSSGAPVADAGIDSKVILPDNGSLDGTGSFDADGSITDYAWTKISGGSAAITSPAAAATSVTGLAAGDYVFQLVVTDDEAKSGTDTCNVTVENLSVTAAAQSAANVPGQTVDAQSNRGDGRVYIVLDGEPQSDISDLNAAVAADKAAYAEVTQVDTDTAISVDGLVAGTYYAYAVDPYDNLSAKGTNAITVNAVTTITRYVNTASSGGDGTTNATSGANAAYASLNAWEAAEETDLVSAYERHVVICSGTAADTTAVTVDGWTTDDACNITIKTDESIANSRHPGKWDTSAYRLDTSNAGSMLLLKEDYTVVDGLQVRNQDSDNNSIAGSSAGPYGVVVKNCVVREGNCGIYMHENCDAPRIFNNIVYDSKMTQYACGSVRVDGDDGEIYNNTVSGCAVYNGSRAGIYAVSSTTIVENNISFNNAEPDYYGGTRDYNISEDTTATGGNSIDSVTFAATDQGVGNYVIMENLSAGTEDFHLVDLDPTHNVAIGAGTNLSSVFTDDIDGNTRTGDWDIGADQAGTDLSPPDLTADTTDNNVDNNIIVTFTDDAAWRAAITAVTYDGNDISSGAYTVASGSITLNPANDTDLQAAKTADLSIAATGYANATVSQTINHGAATQLLIQTQPAAPGYNGGVLGTQPVLRICDQYGNVATSSSDNASAVKIDAGSWTLGGTTTVAASSGVVSFTNLTATSAAAVSGAQLRFSCAALPTVDSVTFDIPEPVLTPPVLTADSNNNNVDYDILITFADDSDWRAAVTAVKWGGTTLDGGDYTLIAGSLMINQGVIQIAATQNVTIEADSYSDAVVSQEVLYGAATQLLIQTQPDGPLVNGDALDTQPVIKVCDQYGNTVESSSAEVTAAKLDANAWTLGGTTSVDAASGVATFADLTATSAAAVNGAQLQFSADGVTAADSATFNIPSPDVADYTVGASGADFTTIAAAVAACSGGEVIEVIDAVHTEDAVTIDKNNLTIQGRGMDNTIVQAGISLAAADDRVFVVDSSISHATIKDMTLRYGDRTSNGGAIYSYTDLTLEYCRINDCRAGEAGGALSMGSDTSTLSGKNLTVTGCVFDNCESTSTVTDDGGGAIFLSTTGEAIIIDSSFTDNTAASRGGAVRANCDMTITGCAISGNTAAYYGGGAYISGATHKVIENSTFHGNAADTADLGGGGMYITTTGATVEIYNSTIAANSATGYGGGMYISTYPDWVRLHNSVVADNSATVSAADIRDGADSGSRRISAATYNLVESGSGNSITNGVDGNIVGSAPVLGSLQNNGGPTDTIMPGVGSPALRAIPRGSDPYYNDSPFEDQRGYWIDRPITNADYLDRTIGACWNAAGPTPARGFKGWIR